MRQPHISLPGSGEGSGARRLLRRGSARPDRGGSAARPFSSLRGRPGVAVAVWLRSGRLDRALADGADPAQDRLLAYRASQLTSARARRRLAGALAGHLEQANAPQARRRRSAAVPVRGRALREASPEARRAIDLLWGEGEVQAQGVARIKLLLTDGASPLYTESSSAAQALAEAVQALSEERA